MSLPRARCSAHGLLRPLRPFPLQDVFFSLRRRYVEILRQDLDVVWSVSDADIRLIEMMVKQLAYAAVKRSSSVGDSVDGDVEGAFCMWGPCVSQIHVPMKYRAVRCLFLSLRSQCRMSLLPLHFP